MSGRKRGRNLGVTASLLPALLLSSAAQAVPPDATTVPIAATAAFEALRASRGAWHAIWDADRGVPISVWGEGIHVPGASADAAKAEAAAWEILAEQLALLAPGTTTSDFVVDRNHVRAGIRSVWFAQRYRGHEVIGAQVGFGFKHDTLLVMRSTAAPDLSASIPTTTVSPDVAARRAAAWIERLYGGAPSVLATGEVSVLPVALRDGSATDHVVIPVVVDQASPRAQFTVWIDAATGAPIGRRQQLLFGAGTVRYHVPDRYPAAGYVDLPAAFASHVVDGNPTTSDLAGLVSWTGVANATIAPGLVGTYVTVTNVEGALATTSLDVADGGAGIWDAATTEKVDAQLSAFVHATIAKRYALTTLDPDLPWLSQSMPVHVNEAEVCGAYSNLDDIHFGVEGVHATIGTCNNIARVADFVYHETSHSLHGHASGNTVLSSWPSGMFALSEGTADYFGATITGDSGWGRGAVIDDPGPVRELDPVGVELVYPTNLTGESHNDGRIIAGALWDLRTALVDELGAGPGVALADDIYYGIISSATSMTAAYAEALLVDDDDADLANGTPHGCAIDAAFRLHGLGATTPLLGQVQAPTADGLDLRVPKIPLGGAGGVCPAYGIEQVTARWRLGGETTFQDLPFTEGIDAFTATLPGDATGQVLEYQIEVAVSGGGTRVFPETPFDPVWQVFLGEVIELYCTDFETDPGWALSGFDRGAPAGVLDPASAFGGTSVLGTALAGLGFYPPGAGASALTPEVDTAGYENIHVQFRRWLTTQVSTFDQARILVDGAERWINSETDEHLDVDWRFQDLDISAEAADGTVQVELTLDADATEERGGWNVDDFCIIAVVATPPVCGNGEQEVGEQCDDGSTEPGDGCSATCEDEVPEIADDGGCCAATRDGAAGWMLLGLATLGLAARRRRRGVS